MLNRSVNKLLPPKSTIVVISIFMLIFCRLFLENTFFSIYLLIYLRDISTKISQCTRNDGLVHSHKKRKDNRKHGPH